MKKVVYLLCAAMLLSLLAGCQTEPAGIQPSGSTEPIGTRLQPQNPGNDLIDYDPDRQIFFNSEAVFLDCYVGLSVPRFTMPIYSKTYIDPADISVSFPGDAPIRVEVTQVKGIEGKTEYTASEGDLPENLMRYYVYAAYRGGELPSLAEAKLVDKIRFGIHDPLRAEYEAIEAGDLPEFYVYIVRVDLSEVPAPSEKTTWSLEKMDITIEGKTYEAKLGRVKLYHPNAFGTGGNTGIIPENCGVYIQNVSELYCNGIVKLPRICVTERVENAYGAIVSTWMQDKDSRILGAEVVIKDMAGNYRTGDLFDPESYQIHSGESVYLDVIIQNEHADQLLNNIQYQLAVFFQDRPFDFDDRPADAYIKMFTVISSTNTTHYENYAIIFDGVDMEPYYDYYHENYLPWRKNYVQ